MDSERPYAMGIAGANCLAPGLATPSRFYLLHCILLVQDELVNVSGAIQIAFVLHRQLRVQSCRTSADDAVFVEVFTAVFHPYSTLPKGTLRWFRIAFGFLLVLGAVAVLYFPSAGPKDFTNTVIVLNRSASIIFSGAFGFTALASFYFGIPWQQRTYGIGTGFLLFMAVDLFAASLSAHYGPNVADALSTVTMLGYSLAVITWLLYFAKPEAPGRALSMEQLRDFQEALDYPTRKVESFRKTL
jgi:hypothetical protein